MYWIQGSRPFVPRLITVKHKVILTNPVLGDPKIHCKVKDRTIHEFVTKKVLNDLLVRGRRVARRSGLSPGDHEPYSGGFVKSMKKSVDLYTDREGGHLKSSGFGMRGTKIVYSRGS